MRKIEGVLFRGTIAAAVASFVLCVTLGVLNYSEAISSDNWLSEYSPWPKWNECEQSLIADEKKYGEKQLEENNTTCMHANFLQESWDQAIERRASARSNYSLYGKLSIGLPIFIFVVFYILRWVIWGRIKA